MTFDIDSVNYNKELFDFLKKIFPDAKPVLKAPIYYNKRSQRPKVKASVIICPVPSCRRYCTEARESVVDIFVKHLKEAHDTELTDDYIESLKAKISYIRNSTKISYTDPFLYVSSDEILRYSLAKVRAAKVD